MSEDNTRGFENSLTRWFDLMGKDNLSPEEKQIWLELTEKLINDLSSDSEYEEVE